MILISSKKDCCGCEACIQRCPKECISFLEDNEGFYYPEVDTSKCICCGLCEQVCPTIHQQEKRIPASCYAAKNKNENIRSKSSSGGIFSLLAEKTIKENGVVFGAKFDNDWNVIHDYTETLEGIDAFRGSKYIQSMIDNCFSLAESFLKQDRKVLFTGTPCQIAGLKRFLGKEYNNLLSVDFICHGVPSPKVWGRYKKEILKNHQRRNKNKSYFVNISFRDKSHSWKKFHFKTSIVNDEKKNEFGERHDNNMFMKGFLSDLFLRPSCYYCPSKSLKSGSDITIADYWGIQFIYPEFDDDKGVSLVLINNPVYDYWIKDFNAEYLETPFDQIKRYNPSIDKSAKEHSKRKHFFQEIDKFDSISTLIERSVKEPLFIKLKRKAKSIAIRLFRN